MTLVTAFKSFNRFCFEAFSFFFFFPPFCSPPPPCLPSPPLPLRCRRPWKINFGLSLKCVIPYTMKQCYELNLPYSVGKYLLKVGTVPSGVVLYEVFCWLLCCICSKWAIETLNIYQLTCVPSRCILPWSQNVWNLSKVDIKGTNMTSMNRFDVFIVNLKGVSHILVFPAKAGWIDFTHLINKIMMP